MLRRFYFHFWEFMSKLPFLKQSIAFFYCLLLVFFSFQAAAADEESLSDIFSQGDSTRIEKALEEFPSHVSSTEEALRQFRAIVIFHQNSFPKQATNILKAMEKSGIDPASLLLSEAREGDQIFTSRLGLLLSHASGRTKKALVADLAPLITDSQILRRRKLMGILQTLGVSSPAVLKILVQGIGDSDALVRDKAANALGKLGMRNEFAANALIKALDDPSTDVRTEAVRALGGLDIVNKDVRLALGRASGDSQEIVRKQADYALERLGMNAPLAAEPLNKTNVSENTQLAKIGTFEEKVITKPLPRLALQGPTKSQKKGSKSETKQSEETVRARLETKPSTGFSWSIKDAPKASEPIAKKPKAEIITGPKSAVVPMPKPRHAAPVVAKAPAPKASGLLTSFIARLEDDSSDVRKETAYALAELGEQAADSATALDKALNSEQDDSVRFVVAYALAKVGPKGVEVLLNALVSKQASIRADAAFALRLAEGRNRDQAVQGLRSLLKDSVLEVRSRAAISLATLDENAFETIPTLIETLQVKKESAANNASLALANLGPVAVPSLVPLVKDENSQIRVKAIKVLRSMEVLTPMAITALEQAQQDSNPQVRELAKEALER